MTTVTSDRIEADSARAFEALRPLFDGLSAQEADALRCGILAAALAGAIDRWGLPKAVDLTDTMLGNVALGIARQDALAGAEPAGRA